MRGELLECVKEKEKWNNGKRVHRGRQKTALMPRYVCAERAKRYLIQYMQSRYVWMFVSSRVAEEQTVNVALDKERKSKIASRKILRLWVGLIYRGNRSLFLSRRPYNIVFDGYCRVIAFRYLNIFVDKFIVGIY